MIVYYDVVYFNLSVVKLIALKVRLAAFSTYSKYAEFGIGLIYVRAINCANRSTLE